MSCVKLACRQTYTNYFLISEVFVSIMCIQYNDKIILIKSYDGIELR